MSSKLLDRLFLFFLGATFTEAFCHLIHGLLVITFHWQINFLSQTLTMFSGMLFAFSFGTLVFSSLYQSQRSNYVFCLSLLALSGPFISTPFVFGVVEHVTLFDFVTQLTNFNFLMSTGSSYKIYFFTHNLFQLLLSGLGLLLLQSDPERFFRHYSYSTRPKKILANAGFMGAILLCSMIAYVLGPLYMMEKKLGLSIDQGNLVCMERTYTKDDKKIVLLPMAHIGDASFYRNIVEDYKEKDGIFLMEGVKDEKKLIRGKLFYANVAKTLGVSDQASEFTFPAKSKIKFVWADMDISELNQETVNFINLMSVSKNSDEGLSVESMSKISHMMKQDGTLKIIFGDILNKRNERLMTRLHEQLPAAKLIVIAWGAAHLHDIEREILKIGFRRSDEMKRTLTGLSQLMGRSPASAVP